MSCSSPSSSAFIGERVRDKIAASKSKGIWVGGPVSLGYRSTAKKLAVVPEDAAFMRKIFAPRRHPAKTSETGERQGHRR
jgi:DNA invertase Pin-like site-specific DNA recombinase